MERVGDDAAGFSVGHDLANGIILITAWGFWAVGVAATFAPTVTKACRDASKGSRLTLDISDLKPMRDEGQHAFSSLLRSLSELRLSKTTIVTASQLTKLQLIRLVAGSGASNIEWISRVTPEGRNA